MARQITGLTLAAVGAGLLIAGSWLVFPPAGVLVAGGCCIYAAKAVAE